jgi:PAS domain S-box-containing protein
MVDTFIFIMLNLSAIAILVFLLKIINSLTNKSFLHHICSLNVLLILLWTLFKLINNTLFNFIGQTSIIIFFLASVTVFFLPSTLLLFSILLVKNKIEHITTYILVLLLPVISTVLLATNNLHGLFLKEYFASQNSMDFGPYYYIHCTWQLLFSCISVCYILYYSLKYTNCLSKQILIVFIGIFTPILVDIMIYLNYFSSLPIVINKNLNLISYCVSAVCLTYAIYRYRFLDMVPIAIRSVIDHISDSFIVVDHKYNILEVNNVLKKEFGDSIKSDGKNLFDLFSNTVCDGLVEQLAEQIDNTRIATSSSKFEYKLDIEGKCKFFNIEIAPINIKKQYMATLILFKNITEHKQVLKLIEENNNQLLEKARLIFLNQLIGGIAHNIKSPLMSSSGGILALENYTKQVDELFRSLELYTKYPEYDSILMDMQKWEGMIKQYLIYISDVITAVKEQAVSLNSNESQAFILKEVLDRVELLMEFELKKSGCKLTYNLNIDIDTKLEGDKTALTQILNNIILNAIQAYTDGGIIDVKVNEVQESILFTISDYGKGIDTEVKAKLFNEMVTTKGKDGTGIGLYIANIAVKGQFRGTINLESQLGKGTRVYVLLPKKRKREQTVNN